MHKIASVSILGCGWLGYPLALTLLEQGFKVKGSSTSQHKIDTFRSSGIIPYQLEIAGDKKQRIIGVNDFFKADLLIITIPPKIRKQGAEHGIIQIENLKETIDSFKGKVIYTSSTSVYPPDGKIHDEKISENSVSIQSSVLQIEKILKNTFGKNITILRLAGLFGYDRIPIKYFLGKSIDNATLPVNYLHRDDAVKSILTIISKQAWGKTYNVVAPKHPSRGQVFAKNAERLGIKAPDFNSLSTRGFKIVNGDKMMTELGFTYQFPDPVDFYYDPFANPYK